MAEFCFECYNKMSGGHCKKENYVLSDELDLCEGCGEYKEVVISYRSSGFYERIENIVDILLLPFYAIRTLIISIYLFFKR